MYVCKVTGTRADPASRLFYVFAVLAVVFVAAVVGKRGRMLIFLIVVMLCVTAMWIVNLIVNVLVFLRPQAASGDE